MSEEIEEPPDTAPPAPAPEEPAPEPESRSRRLLLDAVALAVMLAVLATTATALALPWRDTSPVAGTDLARYLEISRSGSSYLFVQRDPSGEVAQWESQNQVAVPAFRALAEWRDAPRAALDAFLNDPAHAGGGGETARLRRLRTFEVRNRTLADGVLGNVSSYSVLTHQGLHLVSLYSEETRQDQVFDPPALWLPADLAPGRAWESTGRFVAAVDYHLTREVVAAGPHQTPLGRFDDCLELATLLTFGDEHGIATTEWICAGVGVVETQNFDVDGVLLSTQTLLAFDGAVATADDQPEPLALGDDLGPPTDPATWTLARVGRARQSLDATEAPIPPTYVGGADPLVLVASHDGDLVAFDATGDGTIAWRYRTAGTIYGAPGVDAATGRIYLGSSDKHVHALDARGLYLWSQATGDNVASRPLPAGDVVVVGSEDRTVYGLDAATGLVLWTVGLGGPTASSAALVGDRAVIGADDGGLYGIEVATGEVAWIVDAGSAIEGEVVSDGTIAYAGTRDGDVVAVDGASGEVVWTRAVGAGVRHGPALAGEWTVVVDIWGRLTGINRETGRRDWQVDDLGLVGAPLAIPDGVVVNADDGMIRLFDPADGAVLHAWDAAASRGATDLAPAFHLGPALGGGAIWAIDDGVVLRRLGPPTATTSEPILPAWLVQAMEAPFELGEVVAATPLPYDGEALLVEVGGAIFTLDPATGAADRVGQIHLGEGSLYAEPVIAGNLLLTGAGDTLTAHDLPGLEPRWSFVGDGFAVHSPAVADGMAFWVTGVFASAGGPPAPIPATLYALDLTDGALVWSVPLPDVSFPTGVTVDRETVYSGGGSAAYRAADGTLRWRADLGAIGAGRPALSADGRTVYLAGSSLDGGDGTIAAVDAADGTVIWRAAVPGEGVGVVDPLYEEAGVVVVPTVSDGVVAFDAATGELRWHHRETESRLGVPAAFGGRVWLATDRGRLHVLDAATGEMTHRFVDLDFPLHPYSRAQRPARVGDHVVVPFGMFLLGVEEPR